MAIQIRIPAMFRSHVGGAKLVESQAGALREVLGRLTEQYPDLKDQVFKGEGQLHPFMNIYVNDEDVRYLNSLDTNVADGDVVALLPAVAGGAVVGGAAVPVAQVQSER